MVNTKKNKPSISRLKKEQAILREAETQFALFGFEGATLDAIATAASISKHNMLYYFPSKEVLYRSVLDDVLNTWLDDLEAFSDHDEPIAALQQYIGAKIQSVHDYPNKTKIFTSEIIAGAPRYSDVIKNRVKPVLNNQVKVFENWAARGLIKPVNFTHLIFIIWSVTQAYADQHTQFAIILGKDHLEKNDFEDAKELIIKMVLKVIGIQELT